MVLSFAILLLNVVFMPYLLAAAVPTVLLFLFIRHYYLKSAREIKRLEAMSKSECFVCKLFLSSFYIFLVRCIVWSVIIWLGNLWSKSQRFDWFFCFTDRFSGKGHKTANLNLATRLECHTTNYELTLLARTVLENSGPRSFSYRPCCSWFVLSRPRVNIAQYAPRARSVYRVYFVAYA